MPRCDHCLLECSGDEALRGIDGKVFCCEGCRTVYTFIRDEGMSAFYRKRSWKEEDSARAEPVPVGDTTAFEERVRNHEGCLEIDLYIDGIRCASCVWLVEKILQKTAGVRYARVNYGTHRARIRWDPAIVDLRGILGRIGSTGYTPKPYSESERALARRAESRDLLVRFGTAAFLSSQLMIYSIALYAGYFQGMPPGTRRAFEVIALCLTTPVIFYAALPLVRNTLSGLRRLRFTMDSLIVLGAGSAYLYSIYGLASGGEVYFDTAAMIVTLILLGRYIESHAKGRASEAVERLSGLSPKRATKVLLAEGGEIRGRESVDIASLRTGDRVEVRPGEKYAADGIVLRGESSADESLLTGESRPVPKAPGAEVIGGSINRFGALVFEVTNTGGETMLSRIIAAVEEAQESRPAIQGLADRVVGIFVPAILALATLTVLIHFRAGSGVEGSLMAGISVLVIACPCSLGLATPLAVLVYTGVSSSRGILVKGGEVTENTARIGTVIFDKTGTITTGSLVLREVVPLDGSLGVDDCLEAAASVEAHSEHGLGSAIVEAAGGRTLLDVAGFEALPGRGVAGSVQGRRIYIGTGDLMKTAGCATMTGERGAAALRAAGDRGDTVVYMGWGGEVRALFLFSDGLREEAREAAAQLRQDGIAVAIVSGDSAEATASAAARTGIDDYEAGAHPVRKREIVAKAQAGGKAVMMVGDGINDAPALTEARVGLAIGRGTDIAMESADAVLTRNDLLLVPWFIRTARGTLSIIRQNIFWAFFYNIVAIPLAVAGSLHPIVAAGAMASSSLFVVINSLRIRSFGEERS
jgi:Cu2+-exporting ATPase